MTTSSKPKKAPPRRRSGRFAKLIAAISAVVFPLSAAADTLTSNKTGMNEDGYNYELWYQNGKGDVSMTLKEGGAFECSWSSALNCLFRTGKKLGNEYTHEELGEISVSYGCEYYPDGNSYLCVYGWSVDPLVEFYIVEAWGDWRPPGGAAIGTVEIDGGTYDIYETTRYEQPSIQGTKTFQQYWSVRTEKKTEGEISVSEHIKAWEEHGLYLGKMYEVAFCVEGYNSSGAADVYQHVLMIGGEDASAYSTTSVYDEFTQPADEVTTEETSDENDGDEPESQGVGTSKLLKYIAIAAVGLVAVVAGVVLIIKKSKNKEK